MYCVAITFKMTERVEQQICIIFCVKLELFLCGNYSSHSDGCHYGQLVIGSFITKMHSFIHHISCSFLVKHQITQVTLLPYSPDLSPYHFWLFSKLKAPLKGKRFQIVDEIQENMMGQLMSMGRTV